MVCQAFEKEFQLNIHYITSITSGKCWHLQNDLSTSSGKWHPVSGKGWHFGKVSISSCKCYHGCQEVNMHHFKLYIQAEICIKPSSIVTTGLGTGFGWVTWCFFFVFFLIGLTDIWNAKIFKHHQMSINAFLLLGVFKRLLIWWDMAILVKITIIHWAN